MIKNSRQYYNLTIRHLFESVILFCLSSGISVYSTTLFIIFFIIALIALFMMFITWSIAIEREILEKL